MFFQLVVTFIERPVNQVLRIPLSLVGEQISRDREATSEQSSLVCEGASYNEVYPSSHRPDEGLPWSSRKESSAYSSVNEDEDYDGEEVEEREGDEDKYDEGEGENERECEGEDDEDEGERLQATDDD